MENVAGRGVVQTRDAALAVGPRLAISTWFRTAGASQGTAVLAARSTGSGEASESVFLQLRAGKVEFGMTSGATSVLVAAAAPSGTGWHHVVGSVDGTDWVLYLDGAEIARRSDPQAPTARAGTWSFGAGLVGGLADLRIYGRGLSDDDVERLHGSQDANVLAENAVTETFAYDPRGRLTARTLHVPLFDDVKRTTSFDYTPLGQLQTLVYPPSGGEQTSSNTDE